MTKDLEENRDYIEKLNDKINLNNEKLSNSEFRLKEGNEESVRLKSFFEKDILGYKKLVNELHKELHEKDYEIKKQKNLLEEKISSLLGKQEERQEKVENIVQKNETLEKEYVNLTENQTKETEENKELNQKTKLLEKELHDSEILYGKEVNFLRDKCETLERKIIKMNTINNQDNNNITAIESFKGSKDMSEANLAEELKKANKNINDLNKSLNGYSEGSNDDFFDESKHDFLVNSCMNSVIDVTVDRKNTLNMQKNENNNGDAEKIISENGDLECISPDRLTTKKDIRFDMTTNQIQLRTKNKTDLIDDPILEDNPSFVYNRMSAPAKYRRTQTEAKGILDSSEKICNDDSDIEINQKLFARDNKISAISLFSSPLNFDRQATSKNVTDRGVQAQCKKTLDDLIERSRMASLKFKGTKTPEERENLNGTNIYKNQEFYSQLDFFCNVGQNSCKNSKSVKNYDIETFFALQTDRFILHKDTQTQTDHTRISKLEKQLDNHIFEDLKIFVDKKSVSVQDFEMKMTEILENNKETAFQGREKALKTKITMLTETLTRYQKTYKDVKKSRRLMDEKFMKNAKLVNELNEKQTQVEIREKKIHHVQEIYYYDWSNESDLILDQIKEINETIYGINKIAISNNNNSDKVNKDYQTNISYSNSFDRITFSKKPSISKIF